VKKENVFSRVVDTQVESRINLCQGGEGSPIRANNHPLHPPQHRLSSDGTSWHERVGTTGAKYRKQGVYQHLHIRMLPQASGAQQGLLQQRLEQLRSDHRVRVADRSDVRVSGRPIGDTRPAVATRAETRAILDHYESPPQHHHLDDRRAW